LNSPLLALPRVKRTDEADKCRRGPVAIRDPTETFGVFTSPCVLVARSVHPGVADVGNIRARPLGGGSGRRHRVSRGRHRVPRTGQGRLRQTRGAHGCRRELRIARRRIRRRLPGKRIHRFGSAFADARDHPARIEYRISTDSARLSCVALAPREGANA